MAKQIHPTRALTAAEKFQAQMDKTYGAGMFKVAQQPSRYPVIPTGSLTLDHAFYCGGWVRGRVHELWGPEGAGKTTLALMSMAEAQIVLPDRMVGFIDVEHRLDIPWAIAHGTDTKRLMHVKPNSAEEVADMLKDMNRSGLFSFIVVDSVGAMITEIEKEKDAEKSAMGKNAQAVTRMVKIAAPTADETDTTVLFLNQVRASLAKYGPDVDTPGGFALKHSTTQKCYIRKTSGAALTAKVGGEDLVVGQGVTVDIQRNSVAPAKRGVQFSMIHVPTSAYGPIGIDRAAEAVEIGKRMGLIDIAGSWYTVKLTGERVQGQDSLIAALREQPDTVASIRESALAMLAGEVTEEQPLEESDPDDE